MVHEKAADGTMPNTASLSTLSLWAKEYLRKGNYDKAEEYYSKAFFFGGLN